MSISFLRGVSKWALMVALVLGAGTLAQANSENPPNDGPVVKIGRSDSADSSTPQQSEAPARSESPKYWIGLLAGEITEDHPLRAHLDLPAGQGLLVATVVPESPAAKAGVKQNDILLRANEVDLHEMKDLVDLVATEGGKKGQVVLEVFRHGNCESVNVTPEERPASAQLPQGAEGGGEGGGFGFPGGDPNAMAQQLLQQFNNGNGPQQFEFRNFGPGVIVGGQEQGLNMPNGVEITVQKSESGPTKITVKRGDKTWEVNGDDPESLKQLPDDVRPFVERMVNGSMAGPGMNLNLRERISGRGADDDRVRERLERMEKRMEEMMQRMQERRPNEQSKAGEEATK